MRPALAGGLALAVGMAAMPARAELPPLRLEIGYGAQVVEAREWDFLDENDHLPQFRLGAGTSFAAGFGAIDAQLAFLSGATEKASYGISPRLWMRGLELSAQYRLPLHRVLHPYARLGASWDWATLSVADDVWQTVSAPAGVGRIGVQARIPVAAQTSRPASLVFDVGVGYTLRPEFAFDALRRRPAGEAPSDPIGDGALDLGTLPMSGISYAFTVGVHL